MDAFRINKGYSFLEGNGEIAQLTRDFDWSQTSLGQPGDWPLSLKTTLGIVLHSAFPMFLFWGNDLLCFYNDAFRPSLGENGKHPAIGHPGKEVWSDIWDFIGPLIEQVMATGEPVWYENQLVPFYRNGSVEDIYWTFSYSPVYGDHDKIEGVMVTCAETTEAISNLRNVEETREKLAFAIEAAELASWDYYPQVDKFTADARYSEWFGLTAEEATDNNLSLARIAIEDRERVVAALQQSLTGNSGGRFDIEYTIRPEGKPERILRAKGKTWFTNDNQAYRLTGTLQDVTEQVRTRKRLEESEYQFRKLIEEAPVATAFYMGSEIRIQYANDLMLAYWGKGPDVVGKTFREAIPELEEQRFPEILEQVFRTGTPYEGVGEPTDLVVDGYLQTFYFNFTFKALRNKDGDIYGIHHTAIDITDKVLAQRRLVESEQSLRNLILKAPVAMCIFRGPDYIVEIANERMLESWDKTEEEVLNKPVYDVLPEARGQGFEDLLHKVYTTGETVSLFGVPAVLTRNGVRETYYVNLVYDALREADGTISGIMIVNIDVTEQVLARKRVEESEQQVRALLESAPFPIGVYVGRELRIRFINQSIIDVWGKGSDLIGKRYSDVLPEVVEQGILPQLHGVFDTGQPFHARNQRVDLFVDGKLQPFWFNYSFTPLFDAEGNVYGIMNTAADVTDLNMAHRRVEESERNLRNTILQAPVAMCLLKGPQYVIEVANELIIELWGISSRPLVGRPIFEAVPEVAGQGFEALLDKVYTTGETFKAFGVPLQTLRNGRQENLYIDFVYEAYKEEDDTISGVMAVAIDVTEQVTARQKIEFAEERVRMAVASAGLGTFEVNLATDEVFTSDRLNEMWGVDHNMSRNEFLAALHQDDHAGRLQAYQEANQAGELNYEARVVRKDNTIIWVRVAGKILQDVRTQNPMLIGVVQDITEQKVFAEELSKQVRERTSELELKNRELERSNAQLEEFAHAASHDLKEPTRKIHILTDRLKRQLGDKLSKEDLHLFERVEQASDRMSNLIEDMLLFSHVSERPLSRETVDLNEKLQQVLLDLEMQVESKSAIVHLDQLPVLQGYGRQLQQLFQNLVSNALKYSHPDRTPRIDITASIVNGTETGLPQHLEYHRIQVCDNGIGFDQQYSERIFLLFQRLHGKGQYEGTGVGLSIVKKVVENHSGAVRVESVLGKGSCFRVYLPVE